MSDVTIRPVAPDDVATVVDMVAELAEYEKAPPGTCRLTPDALHAALFGPSPAVYGHVVEGADGLLGFALWFVNFSTWDGRHGLYLEDLYLRPAARGTGAGRALMATLAGVAAERGYTRFQWSVLDWNPARGFYEALGATRDTEWLGYRLTGDALAELARQAPDPR